MSAPMSEATGEPAVTVEWHGAGADGDDALRRHVAGVVGAAPEDVSIGRLCGRCGSSEHGRPWASHHVHVSLARSGRYLLTAVSTAGPVGVDVEQVAAAERGLPYVVEPVGPDGAGHDGADAATRWCRLEAAGKLIGTGLGDGRVPEPRGGITVLDLEAPAGYRAALAFSNDRPSQSG